MGKQKTVNIASSKQVAGVYQPTFRGTSGTNLGSIQINVTETCLTTACFNDCAISLCCNQYTEPCHGFETGLKGTFAAVTGCASCTAAACMAVACCVLTITEACHGYTTGERGQFTTSCADLPAGLCLATNYFVIDVTACTYKVTTTRALAVAGTDMAITDVGTGTHTFTPNGAIPTGSTAASWIIKVDCCNFKLATSKALAEAGTVDPITALNSPASVTFTPTATACDCGNGTITFHASNDGANFAAANLEAICYKLNPCGVVNTVHEFDPFSYNEIQIDVCVTEGQWTIDIDAVAKEP